MARQNNHTRIVCTVGPVSSKPSMLERMMRSGMDVARLNFSHATHKDHARLIRAVRKAAKAVGKPIPIIGDLQGPKIRLGELPSEGVTLKAGERIGLTTATQVYDGKAIPVTYAGLHADVKKGERFLIDDGLLELTVERVSGKTIWAHVLVGGTVTSHKGMNFPDSELKISAFTKKDREDAIFGIDKGVDWLALSFVTSAKEVKALKRLIKKQTPEGVSPARVIVKIEKPQALLNFDEILKVTDAVMVARGDLGIEIPAQEVPVRQKFMIEKCRLAGKPVVVATQMMDSMMRNPRPTRAEVSDVANAVIDHADGVMLSGESAMGKYPLKTVQMMSATVKETEKSHLDDVQLGQHVHKDPGVSAAHALKLLADTGDIDGVLVAHGLAPWAESVHRAHPEVPFFLACQSAREARQVSLHWNATAFVVRTQKESTFVTRALKQLKTDKRSRKGFRLAVIMGGPHGDGFDIVTVE